MKNTTTNKTSNRVMKLISMTDFVLEQFIELPELPKEQHMTKAYMSSFNYAQFLKQPLTLGMFVPCWFKNGIYTPILPNDDISSMDLFKEYEVAKERVLFEGFKIEICNNEIAVKMEGWGSILKSEMTDLTIEFLTKRTPTLTPTAIKQIGL